MANILRYSYLRGPSGRFRNPYDHGFKKNCLDFLINGYNEDRERNNDDESSNGHQSEGIGLNMMHHVARNSNLQNGQTNGNGHVVINVNKNTKNHGHVHLSSCNHSKNDSILLGLGLGLGRNTARSLIASWLLILATQKKREKIVELCFKEKCPSFL